MSWEHLRRGVEVGWKSGMYTTVLLYCRVHCSYYYRLAQIALFTVLFTVSLLSTVCTLFSSDEIPLFASAIAVSFTKSLMT